MPVHKLRFGIVFFSLGLVLKIGQFDDALIRLYSGDRNDPSILGKLLKNEINRGNHHHAFDLNWKKHGRPQVPHQTITSPSSSPSSDSASTSRLLYIHPKESEARKVYKGCGTSMLPTNSVPFIIIIGVQKGGTTSLRSELKKFICFAKKAEIHYFDRVGFAEKIIASVEASKAEYLENPYYWSYCNTHHDKDIKMEKSPSYYMQEWSPLRMCQAFYGVSRPLKLVLLLRNPIDRAYSSFFQAHHASIKPIDLFPDMSSGNIPSSGRPFENNYREVFNKLVTIEIEIVKQCGGFPKINEPNIVSSISSDTTRVSSDTTIVSSDRTSLVYQPFEFVECCNELMIRKFKIKDWKGCTCSSLKHMSHNCGKWGDKHYLPVRMGLYASYLQNYLQYFHPSELYIYISETTVFPKMTEVLYELVCIIGEGKRLQHEDCVKERWIKKNLKNPEGLKKVAQDHLKLGKSVQINSKSKYHEPMWNSTRDMLRKFYRPYNEELEKLLGTKIEWS